MAFRESQRLRQYLRKGYSDVTRDPATTGAHRPLAHTRNAPTGCVGYAWHCEHGPGSAESVAVVGLLLRSTGNVTEIWLESPSRSPAMNHCGSMHTAHTSGFSCDGTGRCTRSGPSSPRRC